MEFGGHAPRRATARVAFVQALANHTSAIRELRAWRLPESATASELESELWKIGDGHPFFSMNFRPSQGSLFGLAGPERVEAARDWGRRWLLDVPWLNGWGVFALLAWDAARRCTAPDCLYGCPIARADDDCALQFVLTSEVMLTFGEAPLLISMLAAMEADGLAGREIQPIDKEANEPLTKWLPMHMRAVAPPVPGPHPLLGPCEPCSPRGPVLIGGN